MPLSAYCFLKLSRRSAGAPQSDYSTNSPRCMSLTTTDLMLTNSRMPTSDSSSPIPDFLTPPNGRRGSDLTISFTDTRPDSTCLASLTPRSMLFVQMLAPSPNSELLASRTACSSFSTTIIGAAGPTTSSLTMSMSWLTFETMVGS